MLERAVLRARGAGPVGDFVPELNLEVSGMIPRKYIGDDRVRLELYSRLAKASQEVAIDDIEDEIIDRFGDAPFEVHNALAIERARLLCRRLDISRLDAGPHAIALAFRAQPTKVIHKAATIEELAGSTSWKGERLIYAKPSSLEDRIAVVTDFLNKLTE
jgi:transcription-repair coupling factor (superfamily II helicase)